MHDTLVLRNFTRGTNETSCAPSLRRISTSQAVLGEFDPILNAFSESDVFNHIFCRFEGCFTPYELRGLWQSSERNPCRFLIAANRIVGATVTRDYKAIWKQCMTCILPLSDIG